jgi:hypothetical protein
MAYGNIVPTHPPLTALGKARESLRRAVAAEPTGAAWEQALHDALQVLLPEHRRLLSEFLSPAEGEAYDAARDTLRQYHEAKRAAIQARGERGER